VVPPGRRVLPLTKQECRPGPGPTSPGLGREPDLDGMSLSG
jgi:hypothetical protein